MNKVIYAALILAFSSYGKEWLSLTNQSVEIEARIIQVKGDRVQLMGRNGAPHDSCFGSLAREQKACVAAERSIRSPLLQRFSHLFSQSKASLATVQ